jgi:glycosyltransferase involved in cell wall biosynthesis
MKVSVIIPFHNAFSFLEKSVSSALNQDETGELILIDDHSTDNSLDLVKKLQQKDHRIIILQNTSNVCGAAISRNVGIYHASQDYIAFLDADDYYLPERFRSDVSLFLNNPDIDAVVNAVQIKLQKGERQFILNSYYRHNELLGFSRSFSPIEINDYISGFNLHLNGLTIRKSIFQKTGGFDGYLKQAEDRDFYLRLFSEAKVISADIKIAKAIYFIHTENSIQKINEAVYYRRMAAKKHFFQKIPIKSIWSFKIKKWNSFLEYDFLWLFKKDLPYKKWIKILLLPVFIYRLFSKNDPSFDINRTIPPTSHK